MIAKNPVLGSASGGFSTEDSKIVVDAEGWRAIVTAGPHQQYLLIAGEHGLVGLGIFLAPLSTFLISQGDDLYRLGAIGVLMMTALNTMFNGPFGAFVEGRFFWIMSGILLCSTTPIVTHRDIGDALTKFWCSVRQCCPITSDRKGG